MDNVFSGILKVFDDFQDDGQVISIKYDMSDRNDELINKYKINKVAGIGSTFDKAVNLLNWVSLHIQHVGNYDNHIEPNALKLLNYAYDKGENFGLHCRAQSIILTECLLSLGIKSRTVSMEPLSPYDFDNHVICEYYDAERSKWVMIDPTYNAYITDKDGNPLNVLEIRNKLADEKEVILSKDANYNGEEVDIDELTTYYAKDMFSFEVYEIQGKCSEQLKNNRLICIMPVGFDLTKRNIVNDDYRAKTANIPGLREKLKEAEENKIRVFKNTSILI